jgi:predicted TIM-barrel enzyme
MTDTATMAMLERRRIEAGILKHVYETLKASHGPAVAAETVGAAVRAASIEQGQQVAGAVGGRTSLQTFVESMEPWLRGGALTIDVKEQSAERYRFDVKACKYAEMYRSMGLGEIGPLLSCQRDGTFCEGYDSKLRLKRTQTIMQGATHCDFDYTYDSGSEGKT